MLKERKRIVGALTVLMLLGLSGISCKRGGAFAKTEEFDQTFDAASIKNLKLENTNGNIELAVWDRAEIHVKAVKRVRSIGRKKAQEKLKRLQIEVTPEGDTLTIRTVTPKGKKSRSFFGGNKGSVNYEIKLPKQMNVDARTSNGRLSSQGVEGEQNYRSSNGKVVIQEVSGNVVARTNNGTVEITDSAGTIRIKTTNGTIRAWNVSGGLSAKTTNGTIRASFAKPPSGEVELATTNGTVRLALPEGTNADLHARTVNGSIRTDFPLTVRGKIGKRVDGKLGEGGLKMDLSTVNGSIRISKVEEEGSVEEKEGEKKKTGRFDSENREIVIVLTKVTELLELPDLEIFD